MTEYRSFVDCAQCQTDGIDNNKTNEKAHYCYVRSVRLSSPSPQIQMLTASAALRARSMKRCGCWYCIERERNPV
jgi:hypothetical protein